MAKESSEEVIRMLRERGLTCSKLKSMENKQRADSKRDMKDAGDFRSSGLNSQAELQEKIARAQEQSASHIRELRKKLCPLR